MLCPSLVWLLCLILLKFTQTHHDVLHLCAPIQAVLLLGMLFHLSLSQGLPWPNPPVWTKCPCWGSHNLEFTHISVELYESHIYLMRILPSLPGQRGRKRIVFIEGCPWLSEHSLERVKWEPLLHLSLHIFLRWGHLSYLGMILVFKDIYISQSRKCPRHRKTGQMLGNKREKNKKKNRKRKARLTHYKGLSVMGVLGYGFKSQLCNWSTWVLWSSHCNLLRF